MVSKQRWGTVILAGGASRRMGVDKATLEWNGRRAIDRAADLARDVGAEILVVAGGDYGWPFVLDPHPQAGPCAGVAAGARFLQARDCTSMIVLAVDAPTITTADIAALMAEPRGAAYDGFPVPFAAEIAALPAGLADGTPLRRLVEQLRLVEMTPSDGLARRLRGANTPHEHAALLADEATPKDVASRPQD